MATVNKNFKIKTGLVVEGSVATVNGNQVLTEDASDQYIIDLIGGETLITSVDTVDFAVTDGELSIAALSDLARGGDITTAIDALDTDDIEEGTTNLYFSNQRALDATASAYDTTGTAQGIVDALDTDDIEEGATNKYFSDSLARGAVDNGDGLNYDANTGIFSVHTGNGIEISGGGAIQIDNTVVVTQSDLSDAIDDHNASSGVHGVTGNVVGTTDAQTLSNKTLGSDLAAGGFQITNLGAPQNSTDAATKAYVDAVSEGLHVHEAARVAVNGNISIANGLENGDTAGGVTLATGDRVLLKDQTVASENGIYVVQASGQALRATDFDTATEVDSGDFVFVTAGTYANTGWVQTLKPATIGTDALSFTQFSGAGTFTAGNGLTLDGTEFSIDESITATRSYVDGEIDTHSNATSGVHGVTGNVVGTSDSQTLTNKTLGASTALSANLDASSNKIVNLEDPTSAQDAATKFYVDGEVSSLSTTVDNLTTDDVAEGTNQYYTDAKVDAYINASVDTDDVSEGSTNLYYTNARAKAEAAALLTNATKTNITITADGSNNLTITAENGVDDATTDALDEGSSNLYFTNTRAVDALEAIVPNFTAVEVNSLAKQIAATVSAPTGGSQITAYSFAKADYRSAKFLIKTAYSTHTELTEVLITLDSSDNIAIVEYATVGTNGSSMSVTADVDGANVRLRVTPTNNTSTVTVVGTLLA